MKRDTKTGAADFYAFARGFLHTYMPTIRRLSPKTVEAYRISLECFITFLTDVEHVASGKITFDHFDRDRLKAWIAWLGGEMHYAPRTVTLRISAIKAFLAYAAAEDVTIMALHQAARTLKPPAAARKPIEYLTEAQTRAVLAAHTGRTAKSRRNRMLLIALYDTAARVGEITGLTLADVSLTKPGHVTLTGKGDKTRIVPLTDKTVEHLRVYLKEFHPDATTARSARPFFYSRRGGRPVALSADTVTNVLKQAADAARRTCPSVPVNVHCHMLRKTKAMDLYQQGIPMPIIMRLLGHENMSTTAAFYAFATIDMMRTAINAATPAIDAPAARPLTDEQLQALYSLR